LLIGAMPCRAGALDGPLVVLLEADCSDEANEGVLVREDADDVGSSFDLTVEALEGIGGAQPGTMLLESSCRQAHRFRPRP
jgi:hypothetical protein